MENEDQFAKTLDDENLDAAAGGNLTEMAKDIKFLNALGAKLNKNSSPDEITDAWRTVGNVIVESAVQKDNKYNCIKGYADSKKYGRTLFAGGKISRQDAMIYAMRNQKKYLNLEDFI